MSNIKTETEKQIKAYLKGIKGLDLSSKLISAGINAIIKAVR